MKDSKSPPISEQTLSRETFLTRAGVVVGGAAAAGLLGPSRASAMINRGAVNRASRTLKLGATLPLTGFAAADGIESQRAQKLAIEQWNAKGGVAGSKIRHIVLDLGTMEPAHHQSIVRQLIDKYKVDAVVTGYTYYAGVELDLFARSGIPYLNVNTNEDDATIVRKDTKKYWNIYQYDPTNKWYGLGFPRFVNEIVRGGLFKPASKKVAIIYASDNYDSTIASNCKSAMEKNGWTTSLFEKVTSPVNEWGPVLAKIKKDPPDIIFVASGVLGDQVAFAKQFTQDPTKSIIYGQYIPSLKEYRQQTGKASEGAIWSTMIGILTSTAKGRAFQRTFQKRWNVAASASTAGYIYDGVNLYLSAVKRAGTFTDHRKVIRALNQVHYQGVCGTYVFNPSDQCALNYPDQVSKPNGGIPHLYVQIQNGKDQIVGPTPFTTSKFKLPAYF
jgi:branched-chain amino acid transport system substrate-binding protein